MSQYLARYSLLPVVQIGAFVVERQYIAQIIQRSSSFTTMTPYTHTEVHRPRKHGLMEDDLVNHTNQYPEIDMMKLTRGWFP